MPRRRKPAPPDPIERLTELANAKRLLTRRWMQPEREFEDDKRRLDDAINYWLDRMLEERRARS
jgi:hypothetical protein